MEQAQLTFTDPTGQRQTVLVSETPFRIGRSRGNHLPVTGAEVSREHAEIAWDGDRFVVRDRASCAGTFVNDDLVESQPLKAGDRIRVGSLEFVFSMGLRRDDDTQSTGSSTAISDLRQTAALLAGLRAVGSARVLDHVLDLVLDSALEVSGAERGFIMLETPGGDLEFRSGRGRGQVPLSPSQFQTSQKIPEEAFRTGQTQIVHNLPDSPLAADHEGTVALGIRNVLCSPLRVVEYVDADATQEEDRRIGVLYLDSRERTSFRSRSMQEALETLAKEAAVAIENARLYREARKQAALEKDLQTAHAFQQALLPCRMIGGDFYEYISLPGGALGFTLGDVAGKGAPAGLLGARIQEIFFAQAPTLIEPAATITAINATLVRRSLEARFVTMVYGILEPGGRLRYCNAGHNHPVLVTANGIRRLHTGGLIVGLFPDGEYEEETVQLERGDLLVIFSDGISEVQNEVGEEFGDNRIIEAVSGAKREPDDVLARLFSRLHAFAGDEPPIDDMTALVLRYDD